MKQAAMTALQQAKTVLRKGLKQKLAAMSLEERLRQSNIIAEKLYSLPQFQASNRVCLYLHMKEEVYTDSILKMLLATDRQCFIPHYKGSVMTMVPIKSWEEYENYPETKWKIKQPRDEDVKEDALDSGGLDLLLMPGLGFSRVGERIGRGKGYYDTYLEKCTAKGFSPLTVALAYNQQICDSIPVGETDINMDIVLYPDMDQSDKR